MADAHKPAAAPMGTAKPATTTKVGRPARKTSVPARELALAAEIKTLKDAKKKEEAAPKVRELQELQFRRICVPRVERGLKVMQQLQNLARFKPSNEYREKVILTLSESIKTLDIAWQGSTTETKPVFNL